MVVYRVIIIVGWAQLALYIYALRKNQTIPGVWDSGHSAE